MKGSFASNSPLNQKPVLENAAVIQAKVLGIQPSDIAWFNCLTEQGVPTDLVTTLIKASYDPKGAPKALAEAKDAALDWLWEHHHLTSNLGMKVLSLELTVIHAEDCQDEFLYPGMRIGRITGGGFDKTRIYKRGHAPDRKNLPAIVLGEALDDVQLAAGGIEGTLSRFAGFIRVVVKVTYSNGEPCFTAEAVTRLSQQEIA